MTNTPDVGRMAQSKTQLQLDTITVIGLFTGPHGGSALLRMRDGEIVKVSPGDMAGPLTVVAVNDDAIAVRDHRGKTYRMALPAAA
ncbi:hypothetical protein ACOI1H_15795 [Loktanella sp. DJP18]|uniref:hypothetical protein n=1 Tax=Loktanella sp. DJP18 TaxID=3409788 RepID=UPI003BB6236E